MYVIVVENIVSAFLFALHTTVMASSLTPAPTPPPPPAACERISQLEWSWVILAHVTDEAKLSLRRELADWSDRRKDVAGRISQAIERIRTALRSSTSWITSIDAMFQCSERHGREYALSGSKQRYTPPLVRLRQAYPTTFSTDESVYATLDSIVLASHVLSHSRKMCAQLLLQASSESMAISVGQRIQDRVLTNHRLMRLILAQLNEALLTLQQIHILVDRSLRASSAQSPLLSADVTAGVDVGDVDSGPESASNHETVAMEDVLLV